MLTIQVLFQSLFVLLTHLTDCAHGKSIVDTSFRFLLAQKFDRVQARVLVEPDANHGAMRHCRHHSKCVIQLVTRDETFELTHGGISNLMALEIKIIQFDIKLKDFDDRNYQVLVDEFLCKLHFNVKLLHIFIVLNVEVLSIKEGHFIGVVSDLVSVDLLW